MQSICSPKSSAVIGCWRKILAVCLWSFLHPWCVSTRFGTCAWWSCYGRCAPWLCCILMSWKQICHLLLHIYRTSLMMLKCRCRWKKLFVYCCSPIVLLWLCWKFDNPPCLGHCPQPCKTIIQYHDQLWRQIYLKFGCLCLFHNIFHTDILLQFKNRIPLIFSLCMSSLLLLVSGEKNY